MLILYKNMVNNRILFLKSKANCIRNEIINISLRNRAGHIAPSLSSVDILVALYYDAMNYKVDNISWSGRDRLVFSKAHGCYGLYAILADKGILPKHEWVNFYTNKSTLLGCMERRVDYGIEAGCGSLGHGLPMAVGVAFGAKLQNKEYHTFCVMGDGELQEGSVWEAWQFAVKHELANLTVVIDGNRLQAMDFIVKIIGKTVDDNMKRLKGFGLMPIKCNGHDVVGLANYLRESKKSKKKIPTVIIAKTIKGFGLKCMENIPKFHFRLPTKEEIDMGRSYGC